MRQFRFGPVQRRFLVALLLLPLLLGGPTFLPGPESPAATVTPSELPVATGLEVVAALTETPTPVPPSPTPLPTATVKKRGPAFLGYYVPYDDTSWDSLQRHVGE